MERRGHAPTGPAETPAELSPGSASEGAGLLLHLLEYKAQLLEAVEELHIRRESLQHQMKTAANQHVDSLAKVRKQLHDRVRSSEEEKEKLQALAESMEKEVTNLKEELKVLQLINYNLEKRSGELEQKLALQSKSKETHLSQLGELEKRFIALSRQCAVVKQAHGSLEQKVQEAMMTNKKLTSANEKQQATLLSLTKELEVLNGRLMVSRTASCPPHSRSGALRQQQMQQLQLKMNQQAEVNKTLQEENLLIRAEKQEVVKAMQQTQQLLLTQTQTVCRLEQELHVQEELFQALQLEHQLLCQRSRATEEEELAKLAGSCSAARTARPDETRDLRGDVFVGPPGDPCPVSGDAVLCQDPGALEPSASAQLASAGAAEDQTPPSDPLTSPQCQTPPGEGSSAPDSEDDGTCATDLQVVDLICSSQLSVKDLAASGGSEDVPDGEKAEEAFKDDGEEESEQADVPAVAAAAETGDVTLTQTTDRAAAGEDCGGRNTDPLMQTNDRAEGAGDETPGAADAAVAPDDSAEPTTRSVHSLTSHQHVLQPGGSASGQRAVDAAQMTSATPENPEGHGEADIHSATPQGPQHSEAHGSDASTDPSTCRPLAPAHAEVRWSPSGSPTVASPLRCLQDASPRADSSAPAAPARPGGSPALGSDSQERRVQQSTLSAQICKLEQLLRAGRLRLPKPRRTDQ
ncbi:uncharacterized protein LOC128771206 isoform X2 [Synchiropus splendidus]|uniref:uncharacterized protein LOC128771206 isoform X2 n=1 Tax=Synchiropus splendidus TaxID=270530 RepID=UPI00237E0C57|nr:uncharacterized protein LOC128771206 isoform X2 [Synchiropus splendidus]